MTPTSPPIALSEVVLYNTTYRWAKQGKSLAQLTCVIVPPSCVATHVSAGALLDCPVYHTPIRKQRVVFSNDVQLTKQPSLCSCACTSLSEPTSTFLHAKHHGQPPCKYSMSCSEIQLSLCDKHAYHEAPVDLDPFALPTTACVGASAFHACTSQMLL